MANDNRQNAYLNEQEQEALELLQEALGLSASGVLRIGIRVLSRLPIPGRIALTLATFEARNEEDKIETHTR